MTEIRLFYDHKQKCWKRKRLDLERVPLKYRCPTCGKIVVKSRDRSCFTVDQDGFLLGLMNGVCEDCAREGLGGNISYDESVKMIGKLKRLMFNGYSSMERSSNKY